MQQVVYVMGDIHGDFQNLNLFINKKIRQNRAFREISKQDSLEVIILQCGDFAYFWTEHKSTPEIKNAVDFLKDGHVKLYWVDGNHEDHDALDALENEHPNTPFIEVEPCVYYATFGSVLTLLDDTKVLFVGGADCEKFDKQMRIKEGIEEGMKFWWAQEGIDEKDMQALPDTHIDWVVSHASPVDVRSFAIHSSHRDEASQVYLAEIKKRYNPSKWFHGHYHINKEYRHEWCDFTALNHSTSHGVWCKKIAHLTK